MLKHLSGGQACLASLSANVTANYDRLLVPQQVSVGAVRSVWLGPRDELGPSDPCIHRGCCVKVIATTSWAAGIHTADKLVLVKHAGSEGGSVFHWPPGQQVWETDGWMCNKNAFNTGIFVVTESYSSSGSDSFYLASRNFYFYFSFFRIHICVLSPVQHNAYEHYFFRK